ncbi:hypothetical protein ACIRON_15980 [Nocardioides sp. NPDC101246]|uniref:hypothetical protein n=1 Tax=Nocardioides sp. NPDC101246 TaxID=3364336 RepID=UPI0038228B00
MELPHGATDDDQREQVRAILNLLRPYGPRFQTDLPAVDDAPPAVIDARAILLAAEGTKGDSEYATTSLIDSDDDRLWESFVQAAPYAFSAELWQEGDYLVSLADEGQSVVVYLVPDSDLQTVVAERFDLRSLG